MGFAMSKVITFGELLLRLSPERRLRLPQAERLSVCYGGAEANVAVSLSIFGEDAAFVSALPDNPVGEAALASLKKHGVDTGHVLRQGPRMGLYYLEQGASYRPSSVVYDRSGSSFARLSRDAFDWERIFADADWFHLTGITPALGGELPALCMDACAAAKKAGCKISFDPNHRKLLWDAKTAGETITPLLDFVDLLITNDGQAADLFGLTPAEDETARPARSGEMAAELSARFHIPQIAMTLRTTLSSDENRWSALLYERGGIFSSRVYDIRVTDRVGGGDSFAAGLIYALRCGESPQAAIEFATAASCLKLTIEGDYNLSSAAEVWSLARGGNSRLVR
jgi:2-dehydro-3-deoxygluconokinase